MFYSQIILAKKGPLAKVWLAAHHGEKKLARPQIFATDIPQTVMDICNPSVPLALRVSGHLLLGVVRIYSRKVKYVLHDCTEAMLKLQMAFHTTQTGGGTGNTAGDLDLPQTTTITTGKNNTMVVNFGEYDQVHVVEGFCLPLDTETDWILAEEDNDNAVSQETITQGQREDQDLDDTFLTQPPYESQQQTSQSQQHPSPEQWVPFDPEEEEELPMESFVSDVEIPRAANDDSFLSSDQTRRGSSLATPSSKLRDNDDDDANFPQMDQEDDEPMDMAAVPFDEDDEPEEQLQDVSGLDPSSLSGVGVVPPQLQEAPGVSIGGLADDESLSSNKRQPAPAKNKPRKRRKVVIDNDATELSNDHIKSMIANTGDLQLAKSHPADWNPGMDNANTNISRPQEVRNKNDLWRPFLAQHGACHPALQDLWDQSYYQVLERPCPFAKKKQQEEQEQVEDGSIEETRRQPDEQSEQSETMEVPVMDEEDDDEFPALEPEPQDVGDTVWPEEDMDEEEPPQDEEHEDQHDSLAFATDMADMQSPGQASTLDLGMVNELQVGNDQDDDDETRQALGDKEGTAQKWHQHTVKVLQMLQRTIGDDNVQEVSYDALSKNCSRRTAASVFFELLQLKTWDFIEIDQQDPYGDIDISAGVRFQEAPPNS